jgi:hypothetical protein
VGNVLRVDHCTLRLGAFPSADAADEKEVPMANIKIAVINRSTAVTGYACKALALS